MNFISENFALISKGGIVMIPILLLSLYTAYVIILKALQFRSSRALDDGFVSTALAHIRLGEWTQAERRLEKEQSPLAYVMLKALKLVYYKELPKKRIEPEIDRVGTIELNKLKTHLRGLEVTAAVAPLLGLLGTVTGMVKAFAKLAENTSRIDPSVLAGGIWEALITTVAGLIVAIPAFFAYYYFSGKVEKLRSLMKDSATQILHYQKDLRSVKKLAENFVAQQPQNIPQSFGAIEEGH